MAEKQPSDVLDDFARVQEVDTRNMLRLINELPEQFETALGIGRSFSIATPEKPPKVVFISAIGNAAIAAEMAKMVMCDNLKVPMVVCRCESLPKYVDNESLVVALDYSGKNNAVLRTYREAKSRGASVICMTTSGPLLETAIKDETSRIKIPPGQPARTAIGYLFVPIITVMEQLRLTSGTVERLSHAIKLLKNIREALRFENPTSRNIAKQIAIKLEERFPVIYSAPGYQSVIAERWKAQFGANSKIPVATGLFPDILEGEVSCWEITKKLCSKDIVCLFLRDSEDKPEVSSAMDAAKELFNDCECIDIELKGNTIMERLLYGVYFGDYLSYYIALLNNVNPTLNEYATYIESIMTPKEV